jgi:hypothetical protein
MLEEWRAIPGWPKYEVSDQGRVRSWCYVGCNPSGRVAEKPHIIGQRLAGPHYRKGVGYLYVNLSNGPDQEKSVAVHSLVLSTFMHPRPEGMECCHEDGCRTNNRLANLRWDTPIANNADKVRHGTFLEGERIPWHKVSTDQVVAIRELRATGNKLSTIACRFGIAFQTVSKICAGVTWHSVGGPIRRREGCDAT